jgi:hypothetical protein
MDGACTLWPVVSHRPAGNKINFFDDSFLDHSVTEKCVKIPPCPSVYPVVTGLVVVATRCRNPLLLKLFVDKRAAAKLS